MVNRVFCYSNEEATRSGNNISIRKTIIVLMISAFAIMVISFFLGTQYSIVNPLILTIFILMVLIGIMYYAIKFGKKGQSRLMGFATDTNNNIYCINFIRDIKEVPIPGTGEVFEALDKSAKTMQNPEIIAEIVENAENNTDAIVRQILKVHNYTENSHSVKIKCDYKIMRTGKIKCNKNITIDKSFNCFKDLMNILLNTR